MDDLKNVELDFRIKGEDVHPHTVPLRDLLRAVHLYERAVRTASDAWGMATNDELYLVDVQDKSASFVIQTSQSRASVAERLHKLIALGDVAELPDSCMSAVEALAGFMAKRSWVLTVGPRLKGLTFPAIPVGFKRPKKTIYKEQTTVYASLRSVDVDSLTASIQISGTKCKARIQDLDLALRLGARLKKSVQLEGRAHWEAGTRKLVDFTIHAIGTYEQESPMAAFAELADAAGVPWERSDPGQSAQPMRQE